jgi:hypothetical protein
MWYRRISSRDLVRAIALSLALCQGVGAAEQVGVVVLNSGGVLRGQISVNGERYVVTRPNSVVDVPAAQVMLVADSLDDAYERQRRQLPRDTAEAHLALAEWCLRYDLLQPAARELADARRLDPLDLRVALLERRLAVASQPKAPRPAFAVRGSPDPARTSDRDGAWRHGRETVPQRASHRVELSAEARNASSSADELRELDAAVADLPAGVVERFARKVQPLLVNSCTTSGCHQPGGGQNFQLDRAVLHGLSNRRTTLRNLVAALELVDRDTPQRSELLTIPRRSHGGMKRPILGPRQEDQLLQLVDWVAMVTETGDFDEPIAAPTG